MNYEVPELFYPPPPPRPEEGTHFGRTLPMQAIIESAPWMLRRIFWSPFLVFAINSIWLSGVCEHNLYSRGFFLCNLPLSITLCAGYIHVQALILFKKVLKSLCEIITYEMELSYCTSIHFDGKPNLINMTDSGREMFLVRSFAMSK